MGSTRPIGLYAGVAALSLLLGLCVNGCGKAEPQMVSEFGKYRGYATREYDGAKRTSDYLSLPDGTRLAYDLIVPTRKGVPAGRPMPAPCR